MAARNGACLFWSRLIQLARDTRGRKSIVFQQRHVGAQGRALAQRGHAREQEGSEVTPGNVRLFRVTKRLIESSLQYLFRDFGFGWDWHSYEQSAGDAQLSLCIKESHHCC